MVVYNDMEAREIRKNIIRIGALSAVNGAHFGSSLSCVEILVALYENVLKLNDSEFRDRFILSKGHGALALYCILKEKGMISIEELESFDANNTCFFAHAKRNLQKGIEFSGGSLSLGMSYAVGVALACRNKGNHIYVLLGDGECDEGLVWEAVMAAANYELNNITAIIDKNELQSDGFVKEIMNTDSLYEKFQAFGWDVAEVDGHNIEVLKEQFIKRGEKPRCIIAHTIKGKGVSFMENNPMWHYKTLNHTQYALALHELEE